MRDRLVTPDIMGDLMKEEKDNQIPKRVKDSFLKKNTKAKQEIKKEELKEKATFNLSISLLEDLEDMWIKLRQTRKPLKISKTEIVEEAIRAAIKNFYYTNKNIP